MSIRIPVAMAASVVALTFASASFAQETSSTTTTTTQPATTARPAPAQQPVVVQQQPAQPVATTTTTAAPYNEPAADTSEKTIEHRPNGTLLSTGVGIFVISYGASVVAGAVSSRDEDKNLFIPVAGPWMDLGNRNCGGSCGQNEGLAKGMIITSGIVQGAGVLLALGSLIIPESTTVTEHRTSAKATAPKPKVNVLPVSYGTGAGVGAIGTF